VTEPSESQRLLLRAIVGRDAGAVQAWEEWGSLFEARDLDPDSQWLLPALGRNLKRLGVAERRLWRYENVYRHNWYKNHLALHRTAAAVRELRRSGPVVILGGAAMAMAYYETIGERPFKEVEFAHGPDAEQAPMSRGVPLTWRSLEARSLEPVDQLVEICVRRERWDSLSQLLWQVDAATVLRGHPAIEWSQVQARAEACGLGEEVATAREALEAATRIGAPR
jgi:hypothetical protein